MRVYSMQDGLKYSQVFSVFQGRDGFLWAGTSYGVSRYDGREFLTLTRASGLPHDSVLDLSEDPDGNLWVLTQEGLARISPATGETGGPRLLPAPKSWDGLPVASLRRLARSEKAVWVLGLSGLWRGTRDEFRFLPFPGDVRLSDPVQLGPVTDEDAWVAAPEGVFRVFADGRLSRAAWPAELGAPAGLARAGDEVVLLLKEGLAVLRGDRFERAPEWVLPAGLNPEKMMAFEESLVAVTPGRGAVILAKNRAPRFLSRREGLPSDSVNAAFADRDGLLWLATEDGLVKVFDFSVESYPTKGPELGNQVLAISEDPSGDLWIGHSNGLSRLRASALTLLEPFPERSEENSVWSVLPVGNGTVLAGTKRGLVAFVNGQPRWIRRLGSAPGVRVFSLLRTADSAIWASTLDGLVRFRWDEAAQAPAGLEAVTGDGSGPLGEVRGLDEAPDGSLWIGSDGNGAFRLSGGALVRFGKEAGLPSGICRAVLAISREEALAGTDLGLFRIRNGRAHPVNDVNLRYGHPYVVSLARGPGGKVWVALTDRILEMEGDAVRSVIDKTGGLIGLSTTAENCLATDSRGGLWVGMVGGLTRVSVLSPRAAAPPAIRILSVLSGKGRPVAAGGRLAHQENSISFTYRSLTFLSEERTMFEDRLLGYETAWNLARPVSGQRYTNLEAGTYTLEVRAVSAAGLRSAPATFSFAVEPPWWQTIWARSLFALVAVLVVGGVVKWRTYRLRENARALKEEVASRTRELFEANKNLQQLQEKLSQMVETQVQAREDVKAWAGSQAAALSQTLRADGISVAEISGGELRRIIGTEPLSTPDVLDELLAGASELRKGTEIFLPILGASGDLVGVLGVKGAPESWTSPEKRLALAFAHQLGGALDVRSLAQRLQSVESVRTAVRVEMERKGTVAASVCPQCGRCYPQGTKKCEDDAFLLEEHGLLPLRIHGRYELIQRLGQGGMGVVYLASDSELAREVALKIIRPELFDDPGVRQRFKREAKAAARIQHPGIVSVFDTGELDDGSAFLVMERLSGMDLAALVGRYGMGRLDQVASVARQAGAALSAAHRAGVIHRDIKPENLFLCPRPGGFVLKILDFGLARSVTLADGLTQTGMVVGTPWYLSPEQVRGEPATQKSDLYSLAITLWEALAGIRAVKSEVLSEIYMEIIGGAIPALSLLREGIGSEIDEWFRGALAKEAAQRPGDAELWASTLAEHLEGVSDTELGWPI
ncbi:MAG: Serine/threonine-protein kinase PknD [Thermoanaerobaculia bacterium]|nr:Serine/threonine-protein kinase PknD [Thermoanaerobaculia bacterium]